MIAQATQSQEVSGIDPNDDVVIDTEQEIRQVSKAKVSKAEKAQPAKSNVKTTQTR